MKNKLTMLMILDGFGKNDEDDSNAIKIANTPNLDKLMKKYPNTIVYTNGINVGLAEGQKGNSQVGFENIGAGRVVEQYSSRITRNIEEGDFFSNQEFLAAIENCKKYNSKLHIMGLLSDAGIHANTRHLYAILELLKRKDFENVYIHCFMDGRDKPQTSGESYLAELEEKIKEKGLGKISTISGRFYSMDRDNRWDRIEKVYRALVYGEGQKSTTAISAVESNYQKEVFDEFIEPTIISNDGKIEEHDSVIFFNYRADRAVELTKAFMDPEFNEFETNKNLNLFFVCMTEYDENLPNVNIAFKKQKMENTLGEYISKNGLKQLRISETEKFKNITYFFNGGIDNSFEGEDRIKIDSPKVETYDTIPEMNAYELTDKTIEAINSMEYDTIILTYSNIDVIGHTGNFDATVKAIEVVDDCVGKIQEAVEKQNGILIITSDHGNAEQMIDYHTGEQYTANTENPVPFIVVGEDNIKLTEGKLADVAPTMLDLMGMDKPKEMTGKSLIVK